MRKSRWMAVLTALIAGAFFAAVFAGAGCGDDDGGCPGVTCTNCATDCDAHCGARTECCIAHPDDPSLRCAYCC